jgi:4-aminobutyrate aminotransferase-like enzyme
MPQSDSIQHLLDRRKQWLGPNVATFYDEPVHIVKGEGVWLWDAAGRKYLDCYNNVPHVGHCHPKVVEAICKQASTLNTHTRYLHELVLDYIERLTATMDQPLRSAVMTCTGTEANDLALRMARSVTGKTGIIATDHTYHGNSLAVSQLSTTSRPAGPAFDNVRFVPAPDSYRPLGGEAGLAHGIRFAEAVQRQIDDLEKSGHGFSAMMLCPYFANEGFPDLVEGWLKPTAEVVKRAGGILIADEIQPGFGRLGSHMWGYQQAGILPDIVTLGKPMGNGHPVGALVTSPEILGQFRGTSKYFNTFGGNPVSCAAAMATLKVLQDEKLMQNAERVGAFAKAGLQKLSLKHEVIGDVRGLGFFFGIELVLDRKSKAPATAYAKRIANAMRERGVLMSFIGIHYNVLKMRPPMPFGIEHADLMLSALDDALTTEPVLA